MDVPYRRLMWRWRWRLRLKRVELLNMRSGLSGNVLIQQEILLPEKVDLSLGLDLLLLNRLEGRTTSTNKTSHARMLRNRACRRVPHRRINLPLRSCPIAEVPIRIHGRDKQVTGLKKGGNSFTKNDTSSSACKIS